MDVSDLGTVYALTGEEKYAEYARKLLLAYAHGPYLAALPRAAASPGLKSATLKIETKLTVLRPAVAAKRCSDCHDQLVCKM